MRRNVMSQEEFQTLLLFFKWFAHQFAEGVLYKESQVNETVKRHHIDAAFWRRELVGANLMQRENGFYWRVPFKDLPADTEKRSVILRGLANQFEYRTLYQEGEADELIARYYPNAPLLRQELLDAGLIQGESGLYWRTL